MMKCVVILPLFLLFSFVVSGQTFTSSNLPLVLIDTHGQKIIDEPKIIADMGIIWNGPGQQNALSDPKNNFNGQIGIELRGSSSQMFPKKSYGIETKSGSLVTTDFSLLGMPGENDWILYAPYTDKTMIRDVLTYTLDAKLGHWSPRCRFVELFLNGSYQGVYVLMEKIKRNKNRVDIAKLKDTDNSGEDLTGGYIVKIDKTTGSGGAGWYSTYSNISGKTYYQYDYPKADEITSLQKSYIQTYIRMMENALYQENFKYPGNYHEFLNDSSFIDFMIINELAKNVDGYRLSSYLYKGKNDVVNCGPIWDFNLAYGNDYFYEAYIPTGFQYQANLGNDYWQNPFWWGKLMKDPAFVTKLKNRWATLRKKELSDERITFVVDSLTNVIAEAKERNYQKWTGVVGQWIWPNYYVGSTYADEVSWMKSWITQRLAFLDQQWPGEVTGIGDPLAYRAHTVYPNPFDDELTILFGPGTEGNVVAEIFSISGTLLLKSSGPVRNGSLSLNFDRQNYLPPGIYVLRITQDKRVLLTGKIVKR